MTLFVLCAGALLLAIGTALLYPLLRSQGQSSAASALSRELSLAVLRDQLAELERDRTNGTISDDNYQQAREELERRALEDSQEEEARQIHQDQRRPILALVLGLLLPIVVVALYLMLGNPQALNGKGSEKPHQVTPQQIMDMVERLSERMEERPDDGEGWHMLARSYAVLGRYAEAASAYQRVVNLLPPTAQMLADYADVLAMAQGGKLQGEPEKLLRQALKLDPENIKALALAGTAAFDQEDYAGAIAQWQKIIAVATDNPELVANTQSSIDEAQARLGAARPSAPQSGANAPATQSRISGTVTIDAGLQKSLAPGDTLFVFARAAQGPAMPLAILRKTAADLPLKFVLDDSMAMTPANRLSQYPQLVVGARISKHGDAMPQAGDLEGFSSPTAPGSSDIRVTIDSVRK